MKTHETEKQLDQWMKESQTRRLTDSPTRPPEQSILGKMAEDYANTEARPPEHELRERAGNGTALDWQREALDWQNKAMGAYAQRDELLAGAKAVLQWAKDQGLHGTSKEPACVDMCEAAIAKCEAQP